MNFIFVALHEKRIRITVDQGRPRTFDPSDPSVHVRIGNLLAKYPGARTSYSSSVDWPKDAGFSDSFRKKFDAIMTKATDYSFTKLAVKIPPPTTLKGAEGALRKYAKTYQHGFPLPLKLLGVGKDGRGALLVFNDQDELETFLGGIRYSTRLFARPGTKTPTR